MSHVKIHEHHLTMTRLEVAVERRRLATQLEWEECTPYGDGTIAVRTKSSENSRSTSVEGGAFTMNFKLNWIAHNGESPPRTATHSDRRHTSTNEAGRERPVAHDLPTANAGTPVGLTAPRHEESPIVSAVTGHITKSLTQQGVNSPPLVNGQGGATS
jgi:hypothetical protein